MTTEEINTFIETMEEFGDVLKMYTVISLSKKPLMIVKQYLPSSVRLSALY